MTARRIAAAGLLFALFPATARAEYIVFDEVMYNPAGTLPEYIEVQNVSYTPFDMANWKFADGIEFEFPLDLNPGSPTYSFLKAQEKIIVTNVDETTFRAAYPSTPAGVRVFGPYTGALNNGGEVVTLENKNGVAMTTLDYRDGGRWPLAADGVGHSLQLISRDGEVDDRRNWRQSTSAGGSPGTDDAGPFAPTLHLSEVHWNAQNEADWVEVHNSGSSSVNVSAYGLATQADLSDKVMLSGSVGAGSYASWSTTFPPGGATSITLYLVDGSNNVVASVALDRPPAGRDTMQAFPPGSNEWYSSTTETQNTANIPSINDKIVISEIMYDPPSDHRSGEFIELCNRDNVNAVDISGWSFDEGVSYTFAQGTSIPAGGFLVVAANAAWITATYGGGITVVGDWQGRLSNGGELIRLVDEWGNLVDEVDYQRGGDWPDLADGDGASMELKHHDMDNSKACAWGDSDESSKASFQSYSYTGTYLRLRADGDPSDHQELHFHLVGDAYVILRNFEVKLNGVGANLLSNHTIHANNDASPVNSSAAGWLMQGTHWSSHFVGNEMHLISDGHGDNKCNRAEIDAPMTVNQSYTVNFEAKWRYGKSRLIMQTWDHSIGNAFLLPIPNNLGTPGTANSIALPNPAPLISSLLHSPPVPSSGQTVTVTAAIDSADPISSVDVIYRLDNSNANGTWQTATMFDTGTNGDAVAGDGEYARQISNFTNDNNIVQFYVRATANNGQQTFLPKRGPDWPAMWVVDNTAVNTNLRRQRFVISEFDRDALTSSGLSAKHHFDFERMSNHYFNCTFISNEQDIRYGCEIRKSGSPFTRDSGSSLTRGKAKFPYDRRFRGWTKRMFDSDASSSDRRHRNRVTRYMLYLLGHEASQSEYVWHVINGRSPVLAECTEPVSNDYLDRVYPNGADGELCRIDDEWWFRDSWQRSSRNADWSYKGTTNPVRYHTEWLRRTKENEYDYSSFIAWTDLVSSNGSHATTLEEFERYADTQKMTMNAAVRGWIDDWDTLTRNRGKNGYFYRRPTDGKWTLQHWDSDLAWRSTGAAFIGNLSGIRNYFYDPEIRRYLNYYIGELLDKYTVGSARFAQWLVEEEASSGGYTVDSGQYTGFHSGRVGSAQGEIGGAFSAAFTANGPASTSSATATITGTAPYNVFEVQVVGHPEATVRWTSTTNYTVEGVILQSGVNNFTLNGVDRDGNIITTVNESISKTGATSPAMFVGSSPGSWQLSVGEMLSADASASFDPDSTPLAFAWSVVPNTGVNLTNPFAGAADLSFRDPGLYDVTVTGTNGATLFTQLVRQATVYAGSDFANFSDDAIPALYQADNVEERDNFSPDSWYSLEDNPGSLVVKTNRTGARPLVPSTQSITHPYVHRDLPDSGDWVLQTDVTLETIQEGSFNTGLIADFAGGGGGTIRFVFSVDGGDSLTVKKDNGGVLLTVANVAFNAREAVLRIRRDGGFVHCDQRIGPGVWSQVHAEALPGGTTGDRGGIFLSTAASEEVRVAFDYFLVVDPGSTTAIAQHLRISEVMYNPVGGSAHEFIELTNTGPVAIDLAGVRFADGNPFDEYILPAFMLNPGARAVVVNDLAAFQTQYPTVPAGQIIGEWPPGNLSNSGERILLLDPELNVIHDFSYGDSGDWPEPPDGDGGSLEVLDTEGDYGDPANWQTAPLYNGTPGSGATGRLGDIVINEVLSNSNPPAVDFVELHNPTGAPVTVTGWWLSDDSSTYQKFVLPAATIPSMGYLTFDETDFNPGGGANPTDFALGSKGDEIYLVEPSGGQPLNFVASQSFTYTPTDVTHGRYVNTVGDEHFVLMVIPTVNAANSVPRVGPAVISEIMYNPAPGGFQFIEIENISGAPLDLWDPANPSNTWRIDGIGYQFPQGVTLQVGELLVVCNTDPATFRAANNLDQQDQVLGPFTGVLQPAGERIILQQPDPPLPPSTDPCYIDVDIIDYRAVSPWPAEPDGTGPSLERQSPLAYGNDPANWTASSPDGGTPIESNIPPTTPEVKLSTRTVNAFGTVATNAPSTTFDVSNDGINTLNYTITSPDPWIVVTPSSGSSTTPIDFQTHTIQFASAALAGGIYNGTIEVSDPAAVNSPQIINVTLDIRAPELVLSSTSLAFAAAPSEPVANTVIQVSNAEENTTSIYGLVSDASWLSVSPTFGISSGPVDFQNHTLSIDTAGLPIGNYIGTITVSDAVATNSPIVLTVTLGITDDVLVILDARQFNAGPLPAWNNFGLLGGVFNAEFDVPQVSTVGGVKGVTLDGNNDWYVGPDAPPEVTGNNPFTVEAWVYNPSLASEETVVAWSRRAWVENVFLGERTNTGDDFTGNLPTESSDQLTALNVDSEALGAANGIDLSGNNFEWAFTFQFYDADGEFSFTENFDDLVRIDVDNIVSNTDQSVISSGTRHQDLVWNVRTYANYDFASGGWFSATVRLVENGGGAQSAGGIGFGYRNTQPNTSENAFGGIGYVPGGGSGQQATFDTDPASGNAFGSLLSGGGGNNMAFLHGTASAFGAVSHAGPSDLDWGGDAQSGLWTHIAYTYNGAGTGSVFTDGLLSVTETNGPLNVLETDIHGGSLPFVVGNQNESDGSRASGGAASMTIAVVRIYDRDLSAGAVESSYNGDALSFGRTPTPNFDSDSDGLSDGDEALAGTDPANPDTDGDGSLDGAEVLAGTNPLDSNSVFSLTNIVRGNLGTPVTVTWSSVPGKNYVIQYSLDLSVWTNLNGGVPIPASGAGTTQFVDNIVGPNQTRIFYRAVLSP